MINIELNLGKRSHPNPGLILALGIAGVILIGAIFLNLPISSNGGESIGFLNALLTATSAVSVTGLVVVNTADHWTIFGKVIIILLIQMGGFGFMTLTTLMALITGKRIGLQERLIMQEQFNQDSFSGIVKLTKFVIMFTITVEAIGALLLSLKFVPMYGVSKGIAYSIFHAISAFCNAGFDLIGDSMTIFVGDPIINFTIAGLIIFGGLGYTVYLDIAKNRSLKKLTIHSKLVIIITAILIFAGMVVIFLAEYGNPETMKSLSLGDKLLASFFQSVVARTAGFYSVDLNGLTSASVFFMIMLMFIGGSPSSTAGGIKTTTFGTIILTLIANLRGKEDVEVFKKRIPKFYISKAFTLICISLILLLTVTFLLVAVEVDKPFLDLLFETTSALATVGSTRNVTPELSALGKLIITLTMYTGKVGPLTLAIVFAKKGRNKNNNKKYKYPEGKIIIG